MKNLMKIAAALAVSASSVLASSFTYTDIDNYHTKITFGGGTSSVSGVFDIVTGDGTPNTDILNIYDSPVNQGSFQDVAGYKPGVQHLSDASVIFYLQDDRDSSAEKYQLNLDLGGYLSLLTDVGVFKIEAQGLTGSVLLTLDSSGQLNYLITAMAGDFTVDHAVLVAHSVPEGGNMVAMLGLGFMGLAGLSRRKLA